MAVQDDASLQRFITWQNEYDCQVTIINHQHQDVLRFINQWYGEIKAKNNREVNLLAYMREKFRYLDFYSKYHLAFEEKMLLILTEDHGFPRAEYDRHLEIHRTLMKNFMAVLESQLGQEPTIKQGGGMEYMVTDSLRDVAKWWYSHIKTPSSDSVIPPDHVYRVFLHGLPPEAKVSLLNRLVLHFADMARPALLASL